LLLGLSYGDEELQAHPVMRAFSWCGVRCYSIYLLHWPVTKLLSHLVWKAGLRSEAATLGITLPLCLAASLLLAAWFYDQVERRFLSPGSASPEARRTAA
jgi:peptidoglycan/LPS O-acetylase OafA/YrhL